MAQRYHASRTVLRTVLVRKKYKEVPGLFIPYNSIAFRRLGQHRRGARQFAYRFAAAVMAMASAIAMTILIFSPTDFSSFKVTVPTGTNNRPGVYFDVVERLNTFRFNER